jgi:hypothetical protein
VTSTVKPVENLLASTSSSSPAPSRRTAKDILREAEERRERLVNSGKIRPLLVNVSEIHENIKVPKVRTEVPIHLYLEEQAEPVGLSMSCPLCSLILAPSCPRYICSFVFLILPSLLLRFLLSYAETNDESTQCDPFLPKRPDSPYKQRKIGIDQETQVDNDLVFNFDEDVEAIVEVRLSALRCLPVVHPSVCVSAV